MQHILTTTWKALGLATAMIVAGCAMADTKVDDGEKPIPLGDARAMKACEEPHVDNCMRVNVFFEKSTLGKGGKAWCPTSIDEPVVFLKNDKGMTTRIQWHAMRRDNETQTAKPLRKQGYWVIFTPFQRKTEGKDPKYDHKFVGGIDANKNGVATSDPIATDFLMYFDEYEDSFPIEFKYSIVAKECRERPLDPRIRVHR